MCLLIISISCVCVVCMCVCCCMHCVRVYVFCVHVYVCVLCACVVCTACFYVCGVVCGHLWVCMQRLMADIILSHCLPCLLIQVLFLDPTAHNVASLANQLTPVSVFLTLKLQEGPYLYLTFMWALGSELRPQGFLSKYFTMIHNNDTYLWSTLWCFDWCMCCRKSQPS